MIPEKQLQEIRELLEKSQNPLFFFDNDDDGLTSYLILKRFIKRGKGVAIKSFPDLNKSYARKIKELKPDMIFILDKPLVDKGFFEEARLENIPVVWIDHHPVQNVKDINYFNPLLGKPKTNEPVSYWCYKITKKDMWLSMIGCISDWFIPDFIEEFRKTYPDLIEDKKTPDEIMYNNTQLGKLIQITNLALRDSTTNVVEMIRVLEKTSSPYEILSEEKPYERMIEKYKQLNKKFKKIFEKAKEEAKTAKKMIFFKYSGENKMSSEISNKLMHFYPNKYVAVAYIQGDKANLSLRGKNIRNYIEKALEKIDGRGGGHKDACAASVRLENLDKFIELIKEQI